MLLADVKETLVPKANIQENDEVDTLTYIQDMNELYELAYECSMHINKVVVMNNLLAATKDKETLQGAMEALNIGNEGFISDVSGKAKELITKIWEAIKKALSALFNFMKKVAALIRRSIRRTPKDIYAMKGKTLDLGDYYNVDLAMLIKKVPIMFFNNVEEFDNMCDVLRASSSEERDAIKLAKEIEEGLKQSYKRNIGITDCILDDRILKPFIRINDGIKLLDNLISEFMEKKLYNNEELYINDDNIRNLAGLYPSISTMYVLYYNRLPGYKDIKGRMYFYRTVIFIDNIVDYILNKTSHGIEFERTFSGDAFLQRLDNYNEVCKKLTSLIDQITESIADLENTVNKARDVEKRITNSSSKELRTVLAIQNFVGSVAESIETLGLLTKTLSNEAMEIINKNYVIKEINDLIRRKVIKIV